jgi:Protein of unknown function (DUF3102)
MQTSTAEKQLVVSRMTEIRQLTKEAKQFYAEAESARSMVESGAMTALEKALQCGKRLLQIKSIVGHGNWQQWRESNWAQLSERTARVYMQLARDNPNRQRAADLKPDSIRKHLLTFVPEKEQPNKHRDVKLERLSTLGNWVNEYERIKYRHVHGLQRLDFDKSRRETKETFEFLKWLHGERRSNPWDEERHPPRR